MGVLGPSRLCSLRTQSSAWRIHRGIVLWRADAGADIRGCVHAHVSKDVGQVMLAMIILFVACLQMYSMRRRIVKGTI